MHKYGILFDLHVVAYKLNKSKDKQSREPYLLK